MHLIICGILSTPNWTTNEYVQLFCVLSPERVTLTFPERVTVTFLVVASLLSVAFVTVGHITETQGLVWTHLSRLLSTTKHSHQLPLDLIFYVLSHAAVLTSVMVTLPAVLGGTPEARQILPTQEEHGKMLEIHSATILRNIVWSCTVIKSSDHSCQKTPCHY